MLFSPIEVSVSVEQILRSQGLLESHSLRARHEFYARQAIELGGKNIYPLVNYRIIKEDQVVNPILSHPAIKSLNDNIHWVVAVAGTIGEPIERQIEMMIDEEPAIGLALEAYASLAVFELSEMFCDFISAEAKQYGLAIVHKLNPGSCSCDLMQGQELTFSLLGESQIKLQPNGLMLPLKSFSMVLLIGSSTEECRNSCQVCEMNERCLWHR